MASGNTNRFSFRCLSVDLEVLRDGSRIRALAGVRSDTNTSFTYTGARNTWAAALARLDDLAEGADFLLGHNLIAFDLPHLQAAKPNLRLLQLPVVDTLRLNPLAFPRNPYHHLVKHYQDGQLKRGRVNDPELDARLALDVFNDQQNALLNRPSGLLTAWHWLITLDGGDGFDRVFASLRSMPRPSDIEAYDAMRATLGGKSCLVHLEEVLQDAEQHGWALAYVLAWLSVSGDKPPSVMSPWVRHQFPEAGRLVRLLRDTPCADNACEWCGERHDARKELKRWFEFPDFRPEPADEDGKPLQQSIVEAAMAGEHLLGILPTGTGKSVCYQVPALSRYDKTGALTVVVSPLVALMADQVKGLEKQGIDSCVTINGLLSMPERADALERVRLGDAGILIIAPEQLRSAPVSRVLAQREIGAWVLDEAHCLSKWGHDFRTDYRYVGRFIRERATSESPPPVLCLTATAKPSVVEEILDYFRHELAVELKVFDGGARRTNLDFVVVETSAGAKLEHIYQTLQHDLPSDERGGAIIYSATRRGAEEVARFLRDKGMEAGHFHAGLPPETKKNVQESFISGDLRVIAATNAFGMGIDKSDVRLVVHADIPGSLESYLQEAGRAGRDQQSARCVLLYTPDDVERQFGMSARSRLSRREIQGVLKALRRLDRKNRTDGKNRSDGEVVATSGEILIGDEDHEIERDSRTDDTRVRTAVAWLESAELLTREENQVMVFASSLRVSSVRDAKAKLDKAEITDARRRQLLLIAETLFSASPDESFSTDRLMAASDLTSDEVQRALRDLEQLGIVSNDTALTAFVHAGVQRSSQARFEEAAVLERALIDHLREAAPDMQPNDTHPLQLRLAAQLLKNDGHKDALPERLRRILRSIAVDGRDEGGGRGSLGLRGVNRDVMQVTLQREWGLLEKTAELRRAGARRLLNHLLGRLPAGRRGTDLLAETTLGELLTAIKADMALIQDVQAPDKLRDRALLWLHEQEVIRLNKGLAVLRPAMTIRLKSDRTGFAREDFEPLQLHYDEQARQIHVMAEYAQRGLGAMADALRMTMDYFSMGGQEFLRRWLPNRDGELSRQTTPESWQAIVESLNNSVQRRIVTDDREQANVLVLAGPGSGKTRVLVHRIAYLVRARREDPRGILALAYNRHAAAEIRRRLAEIIGDDAKGVLVLTCHALAMRLVGATFTGRRMDDLNDDRFKEILHEAASLLRGEGLPPEEVDEHRTRLLAGFRWILVDEYQDIGPDEYALISALAGRTLSDQDDKLSLFAVGDDDQNIYTFKGSSVRFIRQFEEDYLAKPTFLTDNYRSTRHIIAAANGVIEPARQRMKTDHPIHVNRSREREHPGGMWAKRDPLGQGRVQILPIGNASPTAQAQAVVAELRRLSGFASDWDWSSCAVVAREWSYLDPVRALCELEGIPVQTANEDSLGVWRLRETQRLVSWLRTRDSSLIGSTELNDWLAGHPPSPWNELLGEALEEYEMETEGSEAPVNHFIEWLAEWSREARPRQRGLLLLTAHRAKGLEFDHVAILDGGWRAGRNEDADAPRRLYYVAMTRSRQTLTLARFPGPHPFQDVLPDNPGVLRRESPLEPPSVAPELARAYRRLSLRGVFLSFAGYKHPNDPVHRSIASLSPGDPLQLRTVGNRRELVDRNGMVVGRLANNFKAPTGMRCASASVLAVATWNRNLSEPEYQDKLLCDAWEVVVPELVFEPE